MLALREDKADELANLKARALELEAASEDGRIIGRLQRQLSGTKASYKAFARRYDAALARAHQGFGPFGDVMHFGSGKYPRPRLCCRPRQTQRIVQRVNMPCAQINHRAMIGMTAKGCSGFGAIHNLKSVIAIVPRQG